MRLVLFDGNADAVADVPGDGFGPDVLVCGAAEAIKTGLLVGELELATECIAAHHLDKPCGISLLDVVQ